MRSSVFSRGGGRATASSALRFLWRVGRISISRFVHHRCLVGASALSYATLVSLVPLTALALVIFSGFAVFRDLRERLLFAILDNFAPSVGDQAVSWFTFAATNAAGSTALGIGSIVITSLLLLVTIEDQLHLIFHVTTPRAWVHRLLIYWTVLTLGPLLVGIGLSATGTLDVLFGMVTATGPMAAAAARGGGALLRWVLPFVLEMLAIATLFTLVPNCRVRWRDSLAGAAVAAALLQLLKAGFIIFVLRLSSYNQVYGALAGIPIFLLWMYIFWIAILMGAEITASLGRRHATRRPGGKFWNGNPSP